MWMQDDVRGLRGQVLVAAAAQDPAQAVREAAPADVVRRRQHVELRDGRARTASACSGSRSAASTSWRRCSRRTRTTIVERGADRRVRERQRDGHQRPRSSPRTARQARAVDGRRAGSTYLQSNVFRYHDTFPHPDWAPQWPELLPDPTAEEVAGLDRHAGHGRRATPTTR